MSQSKSEALAQHLTTLNGLNCSGLIHCEAIYNYKGTFYCITEATTSDDWVPLYSFKGTDDEKKAILAKVASTIKALHSKEIYHGNLKL